MSRKGVKVWIATIKALDGEGNPATLRFAGGAFVDDEAFFYEPRMRQPALMRIGINRNSWLDSTGRSSIGEIELVNADGGLNYLADYAMDGRTCTISIVDGGVVSEYLTSTVTNVSERGNIFRITLKPSSRELDLPLPMDTYAGDNVLPDGVEGTDDIEGNSKPQVWGRVDNGSPVLVNTSLLIYQVSSLNCEIRRVRDRGVELAKGADYADLDDMQGEQPEAGEFRCFEGYFRLGDSPSGAITFDAVSSAANCNAGDLLSDVLSKAGSALCGDCTQTLNDISGECGVYVTETTPVSDLINRVTDALGCYWYFAGGEVRVGVLQAPSGGGVNIYDWSIFSAERKSTAAGGGGLPVRKVSIPYGEVSTEQRDLAAGADPELLSRLASRWRWCRVSSELTTERHPLSEPLELSQGISFDKEKTTTVCQRMLDLLSVRRDLVTLDAQIDALGPVSIGGQFKVHTRRLGYDMGRDFICVGYELNAKKNRVTLELFG